MNQYRQEKMRINPTMTIGDDWQAHESILLYYSDFDPITLSIRMGESVLLYGIHSYHDTRGATHTLSRSPIQPYDDPYDGQVYTGAYMFRVTRTGSRSLCVTPVLRP